MFWCATMAKLRKYFKITAHEDIEEEEEVVVEYIS